MDRLADASTHRNGEITVSDEEFLNVLRKTPPNKARTRRGQTKCTEDMCRKVVLNSILYF